VSRIDSYIPALRFDALTRLYDPIVRFTTRERLFKRRLLIQAEIRAGHSVLDLGCGTGTLAIDCARAHPGAHVTGVDGDPNALAIAEAKVARARSPVRLVHGFADALPWPDDHFDRVLSSLMFHHLTLDAKRRAFREIVRILRRGGQLHVADWGAPTSTRMRLAFLPVQLLDGFETTADNMRGAIPSLLADAGLAGVCVTKNIATMFGTLALLRAFKP